MAVITLKDSNFEQEVLASETPVLVDFWAPWCTPCRMLSPTVDTIAQEQAGRIKVGKVNIDEQPELAQKFDVSVIPTLYLFQQGQPGEKLVAPPSQAQIEDWIHAQVS